MKNFNLIFIFLLLVLTSSNAFSKDEFAQHLNCYQSISKPSFGSEAVSFDNGKILLEGTNAGQKGFYIYSKNDVFFVKYPTKEPEKNGRMGDYFLNIETPSPSGKAGVKHYTIMVRKNRDLVWVNKPLSNYNKKFSTDTKAEDALGAEATVNLNRMLKTVIENTYKKFAAQNKFYKNYHKEASAHADEESSIEKPDEEKFRKALEICNSIQELSTLVATELSKFPSGLAKKSKKIPDESSPSGVIVK